MLPNFFAPKFFWSGNLEMRLIPILSCIAAVYAAELVTPATNELQAFSSTGSPYSKIVKIDELGKLKLVCVGDRGLCYARKLNQYDVPGKINPLFNYYKWALQNIEIADDTAEDKLGNKDRSQD